MAGIVRRSLFSRGMASDVAGGAPAPRAGDTVLLDLRQSLQQAATIDAAFALFGVIDHTAYRASVGANGWSFSPNYDGQGTHAFRADWGVNPTGDLSNRVIHYLGQTTRALYVQFMHRLGRHPADPDANGSANDFPFWPDSNSCKRALFEKASDAGRVDFDLNRALPEVWHWEQGSQSYFREGPAPGVWNFNAMLAQIHRWTFYAQVASTDTARDGVMRAWIDELLTFELDDVPTTAEPFNRWEFPTIHVNCPRACSEYFWGILVWTPAGG